MQFKRDIGLWGLLFVGIGGIIGSGWLFGPLYTAQIAGPAAVISWIVGGVLMVIIALTFAELGAAFPVAGSMVQIAQYSHGPLISFIVGWLVWISSVAVAPVETMAIIQYAGNYIPHLITKVDGAHILTGTGIILSAVVMLFMCLLNYYGAKFFSISNSIITTIKLIIPIVTVLFLVSMDFHATNFHAVASGGFAPYGLHGILAALPLGGVIFSLIGANNILQLAAETKNPQRNIPVALIGAIAFCAGLYALIQFAFIGAVQPEYLAAGWSKLHYPGDSGPFAGILAALGLGWFVMVLYADALISPFGTALIFTGATARVNYGLSKIGFFPQFLQRISKRGVPVFALMVNYIVGLILFLPFPSWQNLVGFVISCFIISYIVGPIALVGLRNTYPDQARPFRLPCVNSFAVVAFYICNLLVFWTGWRTVCRTMIAAAIGGIFFVCYCYRAQPSLWMKAWQTSWWIIPYLLGMTVISYCGTFGNGVGYLPFGIDFVVMALFTVIIFIAAIVTGKSRKRFISR